MMKKHGQIVLFGDIIQVASQHHYTLLLLLFLIAIIIL